MTKKVDLNRLSRLDDDLLPVGRLDDLVRLPALQHLKMTKLWRTWFQSGSSTVGANAIELLQACIYKSVNTGLSLASSVAISMVNSIC